MEVKGFNEDGLIRVVFDGQGYETLVPDSMNINDRYRIWDEWEMTPPGTGEADRERANTIPAYVPPPPAPPAPYTLQMSDFWVRFDTDMEYEAFNDAAAVAPLAKDRRAFGAAMFLVSNNPLFTWTRNVLVGVVGEERADVIMAPSVAARNSASAEEKGSLEL